MVIQALAWALFATALAAFLLAAYCATALTSSRLGNGLLASAGFGGLASEVLMAASLLCYVAPQQEKLHKQHTGKLRLPNSFDLQSSVPSPDRAPLKLVSESPQTETALFELGDGSSMAVEASTAPSILAPLNGTDAIALPAHWLTQRALIKSRDPHALTLVAQTVWSQAKVYSVLALFYCSHLFLIGWLTLAVLGGWRCLSTLR